MDRSPSDNQSAAREPSRLVSAMLGCGARASGSGLQWTPQNRPGIIEASLHRGSNGRSELQVVLAKTPETAQLRALALWNLAASLVGESDLAAIPIAPTRGSNAQEWQILARVTMHNDLFDLPRQNRLSKTLDLLDRCAKTLQADLPPMVDSVREIPPPLRSMVEPLRPCMRTDSARGAVTHDILSHLRGGLPVAMVGSRPRVTLELDRLARASANLAMLKRSILIQRLPELAAQVSEASLILTVPPGLLRPRMSLYEQGREVESALEELACAAIPVLTFGTREELEQLFGVGQGRHHSPLRPIIHTLPKSEGRDLVLAVLGSRCQGMEPAQVAVLINAVLAAMDRSPVTGEGILLPLVNLAVELGPTDPTMPAALTKLGMDLASRRDTFGTADEAPACARPSELDHHLIERLSGESLEQSLRSRILGQEEAILELTGRLRQEAMCRPSREPLRLLVAGPVGTGKSLAAKCLADSLDWPYHYIDATAFDSPHSVMASLAGSAPGIVGSYQDGVLAKIARRPSVVEVADLDHAQIGGRGALCDFFLRILQEGTLQTGSGRIVRKIPSLIFMFTSNVAYGNAGASRKLGFGELTQADIRERVVSRASEQLGHAFISRVGEPVLFTEFTPETACRIVEAEIQSLVQRVGHAESVTCDPDVPPQILTSVVSFDSGARGIIDATRRALSESLRDCGDVNTKHVVVRLEGQEVVIVENEDLTADTRAEGGLSIARNPQPDPHPSGKDFPYE